jgi:signal transduction histidine kinase
VCVEIVVSDSGIGLSPGEHDRIFDRFEQADTSSTRKYKGTGLGLSLAKVLVEMHGGKIWAESQGKGKGSTFRFILPLQNTPADQVKLLDNE